MGGGGSILSEGRARMHVGRELSTGVCVDMASGTLLPLCQAVVEEREVTTHPRHLVGGLFVQQLFPAPLL